MKTATLYLSNDVTTIGESASRDDLVRYGENLAAMIREAFDVECTIVFGTVSRTTCDNPEIQACIRELESGDGWTQYL